MLYHGKINEAMVILHFYDISNLYALCLRYIINKKDVKPYYKDNGTTTAGSRPQQRRLIFTTPNKKYLPFMKIRSFLPSNK